MPNHWESSGRPLFVRTVFVNGNRHAILFEEDPVLRCANSPFKKISRSNSSLSFESDLSFISSESRESSAEERVNRSGNSGHGQQKDLSSELQSCLINLQLASGNLRTESHEKCCCQAKKGERNQEEIFKQKKNRGKREKTCRRKHCESFPEESKENKSIGKITNDSSCYFYNFESSKRKKNYCVVRISSQPSQFSVRCEGELAEGHKCRGCSSERNNMVISATIHNLFMTSRKEKLLAHKSAQRFFQENPDSVDLYWNTYLTKSYYNSLTERVFQWLDLATKRKNQTQKVNLTQDYDSSKSIERICSGKTFAGEGNKTEGFDDSKQQRVSREETKTEPKASRENDLKDSTQEQVVATALSKSTSERQNSGKYSTTGGKNSEIKFKNYLNQQQTPSNRTKSPLKVQDLLLDYNWRERFTLSSARRVKRKMKETRVISTFQNRAKDTLDTDSSEEEGVENAIKDWKERVFKRSHIHDVSGEQTPCKCNKSTEEYSDKIKNELLTERFSQKSINNLNFTRGRPVLIQNMFPSQQLERTSDLRAEKIVWESEKDNGRPQLHIFMPSLKDASDDSMSECENVLSLC